LIKLICYFLLAYSLTAYGQNTDVEFQNWFDFNSSFTINESWKAYGDAGYRIIFVSEKVHRFYIRPSASFQITEILILHGGMGLFSTFDNKINLWEFRPFQGVQIKWPVIFSIPLNHYFRFEERFFSGNLVNTFIFRSRYRLAAAIQFSKTKRGKYFYFPLQLEWFVSYGKDIDFQLNEFRSVIGLGYVIDNSWKVELNTIFQNLSVSTDLLSFNDIIFRFRVYKEFNTY
jgi:hypothetical protein